MGVGARRSIPSRMVLPRWAWVILAVTVVAVFGPVALLAWIRWWVIVGRALGLDASLDVMMPAR